MFANRRHSGAWRHVFLTLAALAVALKVLIPPGFMASPSATAAIPLVVCTDHGAVALDAGITLGKSRGKAPGKSTPHDGPCVFAGHGVAGAPPGAFSVEAVEFAAYQAAAPLQAWRDLAPGRGLAAPPLPARGPPIQLT